MIHSFCSNLSTRYNEGIETIGNAVGLSPDQIPVAKKVVTAALLTLSAIAATWIHWSLGAFVGCLAISSLLSSRLTHKQLVSQEQQPIKSQELKTNESSVSSSTGYSLDAVIQKVKDAATKGLKVGLIVGRTPSEPLPNEEGWEWFSLDNDIREGLHDHHLSIDFNELTEMKKIANIFDKAVVAFSTLKFMYVDRFDNLTSILKIGPQTELITEIEIRPAPLSTPQDPVCTYDLSSFEVRYNTVTSSEDFYIEKKETLDCLEEANKKYEKGFDHVELQLSGPIPYPAQSYLQPKQPHWVMRGLKS